MVNIIVAYTKQNRVIGNQGQIPWSIPDDMRHFRWTTTGHPVIMGRKTWNSICPLKNRLNIVVTHSVIKNVDCFPDLEHAVTYAQDHDDEVYIIGGESIYKQALDIGIVDRVIASEIYSDYEGDRFFPELSRSVWKPNLLEVRDDFEIVEYLKVS